MLYRPAFIEIDHTNIVHTSHTVGIVTVTGYIIIMVLRVRQGEVGGCTPLVDNAWRPL